MRAGTGLGGWAILSYHCYCSCVQAYKIFVSLLSSLIFLVPYAKYARLDVKMYFKMLERLIVLEKRGD